MTDKVEVKGFTADLDPGRSVSVGYYTDSDGKPSILARFYNAANVEDEETLVRMSPECADALCFLLNKTLNHLETLN